MVGVRLSKESGSTFESRHVFLRTKLHNLSSGSRVSSPLEVKSTCDVCNAAKTLYKSVHRLGMLRTHWLGPLQPLQFLRGVPESQPLVGGLSHSSLDLTTQLCNHV